MSVADWYPQCDAHWEEPKKQKNTTASSSLTDCLCTSCHSWIAGWLAENKNAALSQPDPKKNMSPSALKILSEEAVLSAPIAILLLYLARLFPISHQHLDINVRFLVLFKVGIQTNVFQIIENLWKKNAKKKS